MKITKTVEYAATPEEVFAVLAHAEFQEAKCAATGATHYGATVEDEGDRTLINTDRTLPSSELPDFVRSLAGDHLRVHERQVWGPAEADGSRHGTVDMHVAGFPLTLKGTLSLTPDAVGTLQVIDTEVKAKVPLIGGKVEQAAARPIEHAIVVEQRTTQEWLARR